MELQDGPFVAIDKIGGQTELLQLSESLAVGRREKVRGIGYESVEQTHADGEHRCHTEGDFAASRSENLFRVANHLGQGEHGQDRHGEFGNHQRRRHGAELRIHRQHIDEEVGGSHEVVTPCEEEREQGSRGKRPLERSAHQAEAE